MYILHSKIILFWCQDHCQGCQWRPWSQWWLQHWCHCADSGWASPGTAFVRTCWAGGLQWLQGENFTCLHVYKPVSVSGCLFICFDTQVALDMPITVHNLYITQHNL